MGQYRISDLNLEVNTNSHTLLNNLERFKTTFDYKPNIRLSISDDQLLILLEEFEGVTADVLECEYLSAYFARELFDFNGFPLFSTGVEHDGKAILFASPFEKVEVSDFLPKDEIFSVNCPAVRLIGKDFIAYDTPFGMKGDQSKPVRLPLSSIVFVDSERFDSLKRLDANAFIPMFVRAVSLGIKSERIKHTLFTLEKLMHSISFYGVKNLYDIDFILEKVSDE